MFQSVESVTQRWIAQATSPYSLIEQLPIEETTLVFSGPKFVLALVAGVLMAFAFQLLFTNLAIAVVAAPDSRSDSADSESLGEAIRGIETKVGLGLLVSVSITLFAASFLAVKLSLVGSGLLGAITGVVIWSIFFTLLTWLGSTALGSLLGSVINTATAGVQGLLGTGTAILGANVAKNQAISTAEDITAAVRRELTTGFDPDSIRATLQGSLDSLQLPKLDLDQIRGRFEKLLKDADLGSITDSDLLKNVDRNTLVELVRSRTDLSKQEVDHIAEQLESAWKQVVGQSGQVDTQALIEQLKSATPDDLQAGKLNEQLGQAVKSVSGKLLPGSNLTSAALEFGATAVLGRVLQNTDLSDLDVEKIAGRLQTLQKALLPSNGQSSGQVNGSNSNAKTPKPFSVIQADLVNYLLFSTPWHLNRETVKR